MTTTKQSWLKRSLAVLLAVMMVMSMGVANVFAQTAAVSADVTDIGKAEATLMITDNNNISGTKFGVYKVQKKTDPAPEDATGFTDFLYVWNGNSATAKLTNLEPGTEYVVYAAIAYFADGSVGSSTYTEMVSAEFTTEAEASALSVSVTDITDTGAALTITDNNNITGTKFGLYKVLKEGEAAPSSPAEITNFLYSWSGNQVSGTLSGLEANTNYVVYATIAYFAEGDVQSQAYTEIVSAKFTTQAGAGEVGPTEGDVMSLSYRENAGGELTTKYYEDYSEAVEEMNALPASYTDVTLKLMNDLNISVETEWGVGIEINRTSTLDLNGHTIFFTTKGYMSAYGILAQGDLTFTLTDSSAEKTGAINYESAWGNNAVSIGSSRLDAEACDVHFIMNGGHITSTMNGRKIGKTLNVSRYGEAVISNSRFDGLVQVTGKLTMKSGEIEGVSPVGVLIVGDNGDFTMEGGSIRNVDTDSAAFKVAGVSANGTNSSVKIKGGDVSSVNGCAVYIENNNSSNTEIGGDVKLFSENAAPIQIGCDYKAKPEEVSTLKINSGTVLEGADYIIEISEMNGAVKDENTKNLDIQIGQGVYMKYGADIPFYHNSSYVTYPEGMVLDVEPISDGTYEGYYTLTNKEDLKQTVGTIEYGYQYMGDLNVTLESAKSIYDAGNENGTYDDALWKEFAKTYERASLISANENANQNEIDYFTNWLGGAQMEMVNNAESGFDVSNLPDGTYSVQVEMWQTTELRLSMANDAVVHDAMLVVKDGVGTLEVEFKPSLQAGYWGSLMRYWIYDGNTPDEAKADMFGPGNSRTEVSYLSYGHVNMSTGEITPIAGTPSEQPTLENDIRPTKISISLPYMGSSNNYNKIYSRVSVDMMSGEAGVGDQNCILLIKYSTLEAVDIQPTLSLSADKLSMMVGGEETVTATLKGADGYVVTKWESSNTGVATVDNGKITAVGKGTATITVTASNGTNSISKTIAVTVAPEGSEAVKVAEITTSGNTETAILSGNFLTSGGADGVTVNGNTITVDAKSDASGITASNVVIPQETAQALAGKTVVVETNTGSITLDSALLAQIAGVDGGVTLSIAKAAVPTGLGTFSSAYELSLTNDSGDKVEFGEGKATVTVSSEEAVNYAYCIDNESRTERVSTSTSGNNVSFTVSGFGLWALSDREYEAGGASTGFFLEDGNYYVDIALWKSDSNEASMGNVAFKNNDKALVTVKDGKITRVQIGTNPVDIDPYHSAIIKFELADGTEVSIDATGDLTTLPANEKYTYIKLVSFNLPDSAQPDISDAITYVPVEFYVPDTPMDAAVGETLYARLRFTWSTAEKTDDTSLKVDDTTAAGDSSITGEEIVDVNLEDKATGIKLETNSGILSDKAVLSVEKLTQGADYDIAKKAMNGVDDDWNLYKIVALVDGVETAPLGSVVLYIPCGAEGMTLYRVNADGTKTLVKGEVQDGYYVVRTTSLGLFAMVGETAGTSGGNDNQGGNQNQGNATSPQTGDSSNVAVFALLALAAAGMMGVTLVTRKRKAEEK